MSDKSEDPQETTSLRNTLVAGSEEVSDTNGATSFRRNLMAGSEEASDTQGATLVRQSIIAGSEEYSDTICDPLIENVRTKYVRAKYLHDVNVKSNRDTEDCNITGVVVLPDGRLAVSDIDNKCVKIIDTVTGVVETARLTSKPKDITLIGEDQIAVVLYKQDYIQVLSLSPTLSASHTIAMPGRYNCITYSEGKLILTCWNPDASVHICDRSGNLLQKIHKDNKGNKIFIGTPSRITTSPDHSLIYVSDFTGNKVLTVSRAGVVLKTYVNDRLNCPRGVTVDNTGYLYVCSNEDNTVHQLSANGQFIKILLESGDGIVYPYAIIYSAGKLYISSSSDNPAYCNNIKVYRLE